MTTTLTLGVPSYTKKDIVKRLIDAGHITFDEMWVLLDQEEVYVPPYIPDLPQFPIQPLQPLQPWVPFNPTIPWQGQPYTVSCTVQGVGHPNFSK